MATPYMVLTLPVVGPAGTVGPTWATYLNTALTSIDSHDHTTGKGVKITPTALNINSALDLNSYGLTTVAYEKFVDQTTNQSDYTSIYVKNGDFYYRNASGTVIQITTGSTINVSGVGGIGGDYTTSSATVTYTTASTVFTFKQDSTKTADIAAGSLYVYEDVTSGKYAKISAPTGLAANYAMTLPSALPSTKKPMSMDVNGAIYADNAFLGTNEATNYTIVPSVASSALTIDLKTVAAAVPSVADPVSIGFRSSTVTSGTWNLRQAVTTTTLTVPSTATLGHVSAKVGYIYVYALDNAGTVELAVSSSYFTEGTVLSTTILNASSTNSSVVYSTVARTNVPIRLLGRLTSNQTVAGTWAAVPTLVTLGNLSKDAVPLTTSGGFGTASSTSSTWVQCTSAAVALTNSGKSLLCQAGAYGALQTGNSGSYVELSGTNTAIGDTEVIAKIAITFADPNSNVYGLYTQADYRFYADTATKAFRVRFPFSLVGVFPSSVLTAAYYDMSVWIQVNTSTNVTSPVAALSATSLSVIEL